jgi:hypothetical protein
MKDGDRVEITKGNPGAHLASDLRRRPLGHAEQPQRPGDGWPREQPARLKTAWTDDDYRAAGDAQIPSQEDEPLGRALTGTRWTPDLPLAHAVPVQHQGRPRRLTRHAAARTPGWPRLVGGRPPLRPVLDLQRGVYKPLIAPRLLKHILAEHGAEGAANTLRATFFYLADVALLRLLVGAATSSTVKREDHDAMANGPCHAASPSHSVREEAAEGVIKNVP